MKTTEEILAMSSLIPGLYSNPELESLIGLVRRLPRNACVVELGTEYGKSGSVFLQLQEEFNLDITFIDIRVGDHRAESLRVFNEVSAPYKGWEGHWVLSESIDWWYKPIHLLHIDSEHSNEAVTRDLAQWGPWIVPQGIVVLHDYDRTAPDGEKIFPGFTAKCVDDLFKGKEWAPLGVVDTQIAFRRTTRGNV